jgi:hypothetical protein
MSITIMACEMVIGNKDAKVLKKQIRLTNLKVAKELRMMMDEEFKT